MAAKKKTENTIDPELASKILRDVPNNNAFYFFTGIGQYSGKFATSLAEFCQKIKTIDVTSIDFHFKRRDFQEWIRETIGDVYLANEIDKIDKTISREKLGDRIYQIVKRRLTILKRLLASERGHLRRI